MEDIKLKTESLTRNVTLYIETYIKLMGVTATKKITGIASFGVIGSLVLFLFMFILFFLGVGLALWAGEALGNEKAGYFIVAGFYSLCMIVLLALGKNLLFPFIRNYIIKKVYE